MNKSKKLTQDALKSVVRYDKETGDFYRLKSDGRVKAGLVKQKPCRRGYLIMRIYGIKYKMHRLAWLYVYGEFPVGVIDHIDGDTENNKISNLRECSQRENCQNTSKKSIAKSGLKGVYSTTQENLWRSKIVVNRKRIDLGCYKTPEEAHEAYLEAKRKYHTFNPEFTR